MLCRTDTDKKAGKRENAYLRLRTKRLLLLLLLSIAEQFPENRKCGLSE
jgi:hypothetical protein